MKKLLVTLLITCLPFALMAEPKVGSTLSPVVLDGNAGGLVSGGAWDSAATFKGKVTLVFYVDVDEKDLNSHAVAEFKKVKRTSEKFQSVVIINMDATWKPNSIISSLLEDSQKENPKTIYVKDMKKALVKSWNMGDDTSDIMAIGPMGEVLFARDGKLSDADIKDIMAKISAAIAK